MKSVEELKAKYNIDDEAISENLQSFLSELEGGYRGLVEERDQLILDLEKLNAVIDSAPCTISWIDKDYNYLGVNDVLSKICQMDKEAFQKKRVGEITDSDYFYNFAKKLFNSKEESISDELQSDIDGEKFYFLTVGRKYNKDTEAVIIGFDITKQKMYEQRLFFADKMSTLGEMAAGVAHEVNNPLTLIHNRSKQLGKILVNDPETKEKIDDIRNSIDKTVGRITRLISGLKNFSRNEKTDNKEMTALKLIVEDALELCHEKMKKNSVKLEAPALDGDFKIPCRESQVVQVLVNIMNNAVDAIVDKEDKWIHLDVQPLNNYVVIKITDCGDGIDPKIEEQIFQPFYSTKEVGKGTGLGLSISKGIIEDHGGSLKINHKHKNTQFVITLPLMG